MGEWEFVLSPHRRVGKLISVRNFKPACPALAFVVLLVANSLVTAQAVFADRSPVVIDTDVGTGIDDAFALGLAFGSEELDVRGVTTSGDPAQKKAMMVCRFLTMTGRRHTRVAVGADPQPARPITDQEKYHYHPDPLFNRTTRPEDQPAADFLHSRIKGQPGKVTVVALGPLTNIARLIESHAEAVPLIRRVVLLEANLSLDTAAASKVFASGVPLLVLSTDACRDLTLDDAGVKEVFSPGTPLTRQVETMYQMWDKRNPPLGEALAVALCFDERFATIEKGPLAIDDAGGMKAGKGEPNARLVTSVKSADFVNWYVRRIGSLVAPSRRPGKLIAQGGMPHRVHVAEDFENDIERKWWMSGKPETQVLPPSSKRACRGVLTHDFDDLLMVSRQMYSAVIFNPVPGPPMGMNTRLSFRYWLKGTDTIRVQIYSLTNGYHRHLVVNGLSQQTWRYATVDMTQARRPDGTGGALAENERIDDIQFYADPDAEVVIDDIVLYDAATDGEKRPFPGRILFTGLFDTGKQGQEWPGDFEIIPDAGNFWKAARSVVHPKTGEPWLRIGLRGQRRLGAKTQLSFRYKLAGAAELRIRLLDTHSGESQAAALTQLGHDQWARTTVEFSTDQLPSIDEIQLLLPKGAELLVDDLILFEPPARR
jgi:inosine-uridine nucleoside N-ribohydrolase